MARKKLYRHTFKRAGTYRTSDGREVNTTEGGAINGPKEMFEPDSNIVSRPTKAYLPQEASAQDTETTDKPEKGTSATKTKK